MQNDLYLNTVTPLLWNTLNKLMSHNLFEPFRLVGGTALSLQLGHRRSDDIDLFTDSEYGSIDFKLIQSYLRTTFPYCAGDCGEVVGFGASYMIGESEEGAVKLDLFYTEPFIRPIRKTGPIRLTSLEDIVAMKLDIMGRGGRKKDFWDIHELHNYFTIKEMLRLYEERFPYNYTSEEIIAGLRNFEIADTEPDPKCLKQKTWQKIKSDFSCWMDNSQ